MLLREMMVIFVTNELDRTQNESVILYFKAFLNYLLWEAEQNHEQPKSR
jgi:hypothetical protein